MLYPHSLNVKSEVRQPKESEKILNAIRTPLPREHGAWGLLLQPFIAGMAIAGTWTWYYLPALGLALFGFLLREPLLVFVRQKFIWKRETAETHLALRWTAAMSAGAVVCALLLVQVYPPLLLAALLLAGMLMTIVAVGLSLKNLQRSMSLQIVSAVGLTTTGWLALLAAGKQDLPQGWLLWGLLAAHAVAAIPIVHARLQMKAHKASLRTTVVLASALQALSLTVAFTLWWQTSAGWIPLAFSAAGNTMELLRLRDPLQLGEPLKRLGLRLLGVSILHTALSVFVLLNL